MSIQDQRSTISHPFTNRPNFAFVPYARNSNNFNRSPIWEPPTFLLSTGLCGKRQRCFDKACAYSLSEEMFGLCWGESSPRLTEMVSQYLIATIRWRYIFKLLNQTKIHKCQNYCKDQISLLICRTPNNNYQIKLYSWKTDEIWTLLPNWIITKLWHFLLATLTIQQIHCRM